MNTQISRAFEAGDVSFSEEADEPIDAWTLAELSDVGELASVRSACAGVDDFNA